ncbi:hypothetical protein DL89DRAFT_266810 [Linderina pennispora]|uniref:Ubiquitin-like domain-containing protein n=1 Tax=Linderina pennispora TaxID=61395 RepID=A0A1Y1WB05_9FUNG|nr:uncharacterized protein DL89DRAFT_266810 [Linderina pennispora]ORX70622.1 hypothetical protein DL89DRAFT_266810 [Linderina pennispora]
MHFLEQVGEIICVIPFIFVVIFIFLVSTPLGPILFVIWLIHTVTKERAPKFRLFLTITAPDRDDISLLYVNTKVTIGEMKKDIFKQLPPGTGTLPIRIKLDGYELLDSSQVKDILRNGDRLAVSLDKHQSSGLRSLFWRVIS